MRSLFFLLVATTLTLVSCSGPQSLTYNPDLEAGDELSYRSSNTSESEVMVMGQTQKSVNSQIMDVKYTVDKVGETGADMRVVIQDMEISQITPQMTIEYDSKKKESGGMFDGLFSPMVGHEMKFMLDKEGNVKQFSGAKEMFEKMFEGSAMPGMEMMKGMLEAQYGDNAMEQNFDILTKYIPNRTIKVGESWVETDTLTNQVELISTTTYTLKKRANGIAYIELEGKVASMKNAQPMDMGTMKIKYKLSGIEKGTVEIDEKTGFTLNSDVNLNLSGMMEIESDMTGAMSMDTKISTNQKFERIKQ
jgi:hypothetical protein